jgi:hypothetical protein
MSGDRGTEGRRQTRKGKSLQARLRSHDFSHYLAGRRRPAFVTKRIHIWKTECTCIGRGRLFYLKYDNWNIEQSLEAERLQGGSDLIGSQRQKLTSSPNRNELVIIGEWRRDDRPLHQG